MAFVVLNRWYGHKIPVEDLLNPLAYSDRLV